ncbi:MAG: porin [Rickettsiales bacterium]
MQKLMSSCLCVSTIMLTTPSLAQSNQEILKQLQTMQAQMNAMQKEMNKLKRQLVEEQSKNSYHSNKIHNNYQHGVSSKQSVSTSSFISKNNNDTKNDGDEVIVTLDPAPKFKTRNGDYSFGINGFAQIDAGIINDDKTDHADGTNIRRARLSASGKFARDFKYKIQNDFAGNSSKLTDVYLQYTGFSPVTFTVGQFKEPFGLNTLTSDLFTNFIERASVSIFSPERNIGIMASSYGSDEHIGHWTAAIGGFGGSAGSTKSTDDESKDVTARLTLAPIAEKNSLLHFGVAGSHRIPSSSGDSFTFSSTAENNLSTDSTELAVNTGTISNVDSANLLGLEIAASYDSFGMQGEYVNNSIKRKSASDINLNGYYIEAYYYLTGENNNYITKSAKFDRVNPNNPFGISENGWGAWQLMARYSSLDLTDKNITGGKLRDTTLGIKWLPNSNTMVSANYIISDTDNKAVTPNDDPQIWILRTQFDF